MTIRWRSWIIVLCLWPVLSFSQTVILNSVVQNSQNKSWQLNLSGINSNQIHYFFLKNPNRLVIDVKGVKQLNNLIKSENQKNFPFQKIRNSTLQQSMRLVFELKPSLPVSLFKVVVTSPQSPKTISKIVHPRDIIVVIDPGHGGKDPGASMHAIQEKTIVLNIAKKLATLIDQQPGFKAVLTRNDDYFLTLRERLAIARKNKADMFIAIHADTYSDPMAHGVSVFALSQRGATSEAARWLAARENQSELVGGIELPDKNDMLRSVLINLSQSATIQASISIGQNLLNRIHPFAHMHYDRIEQAAFVVLKSPDIPSLLVETGFLSNAHESHQLTSTVYQYNLAHAMMLGIKQYFIHRPPQGTWLAAQDSRYKNV